MQVRCPRCDTDEGEGYPMCSRCGLRFDHTRVIVSIPVLVEADEPCEHCDRQRFYGRERCERCGRAPAADAIVGTAPRGPRHDP